MTMLLNRAFRIVTIVLFAVSLTACANTIRGAGRDISNTADATGDAVKDVAN